MTLIEGLLVLLVASGGLAGLLLGAVLGGPLGAALGGVLGGVTGFALYAALVLGLWSILRVWYWLFPLRPRCARGACGQDDNTQSALVPEGAAFTCRCGDEYICDGSQPDGREYFWRLLDARKQPYMTRHGLRWRPDPRPLAAPFR